MQIICHLSWAATNIIFIMNVGTNQSSLWFVSEDQHKDAESPADALIQVRARSGMGKTHTLIYKLLHLGNKKS